MLNSCRGICYGDAPVRDMILATSKATRRSKENTTEYLSRNRFTEIEGW